MKIYTKTGDQGDTSLFSGKRVRKNNIRIDSYGTVDELNSYIGMIRDQIQNRVESGVESGVEGQADDKTDPFRAASDILLIIQSKLFTLGAMLATPSEKGEKLEKGEQTETGKKKKKSRLQIELIGPDDILLLEKEMDRMNEELPEMTHFILPGGHPAVSFCHIARCVCRRAERKTVELHDLEGIDVQILTYLNRLSDYLFVLARKLTKDLGVAEIPWKG